MPVSLISDLLDGNVKQTVNKNAQNLYVDGNKITFIANKKYVLVNGKKKFIFSSPKMIDGKLYVPTTTLNLLKKSLGAEIKYSTATKKITIKY